MLLLVHILTHNELASIGTSLPTSFAVRKYPFVNLKRVARKIGFSTATQFFLLQPTRRNCCSLHLFVPLISSHLVLSNVFYRIFFNVQIMFFPIHFDSHINAAMNDLYDKILFSLVLSLVLISWLFQFFLLDVTHRHCATVPCYS